MSEISEKTLKILLDVNSSSINDSEKIFRLVADYACQLPHLDEIRTFYQHFKETRNELRAIIGKMMEEQLNQ